ncbi:hypothetical protein NQZ68_002473 [Dissostichus eleginoides]|nr:hypothetical protein NQZ68_002473 [Dissostichus eleginoides]
MSATKVSLIYIEAGGFICIRLHPENNKASRSVINISILTHQSSAGGLNSQHRSLTRLQFSFVPLAWSHRLTLKSNQASGVFISVSVGAHHLLEPPRLRSNIFTGSNGAAVHLRGGVNDVCVLLSGLQTHNSCALRLNKFADEAVGKLPNS